MRNAETEMSDKMVQEKLQLEPDQQTHRQDAGIQADAWMVLWKADDLRVLDINSMDIEVHEGEVWLLGHVVDSHHRQLAENLVKAVSGVSAVHNELVADPDLGIKVAQTLAADPRTRPYNVRVGAYQGWIHLSGNVPTPEAQSAAEEVAANVPVVRGVVTLPRLSGGNGSICPEADDRQCLVQPCLGDHVYASDGLAGRVAQVIINLLNRMVSHIVVAADFEIKGQTVRGTFIVPAEAVKVANEGNLFLSDTLVDLASHPVFQEADFPHAPADWRPPYPYAPGTVRWSRLLENN